MADKRIQDLTPASSVQTSDRFVLEQSGQAKSLTGQILLNDLAVYLDGHGGIADITYTPPSSGELDGTLTVTLADETVETFAVTNGKGIASITKTAAVPPSLTDTYTITYNDGSTPFVFTIDNGRSIESIAKTDTQDLVDEYTIYYNDDTTSTFTVTNGEKGDTGDNWYVHIKWSATEPTQDSDMSDTPDNWIGIYSGLGETAPTSYSEYTWFEYKGETGDTGNGIESISLYSSSGVVDTYRVLFTNGSTTTFDVTNGSNISSITKTSSAGLTDTYTVTLTNGDTTNFTVSNAKSITSITPPGNPGLPGQTDRYIINFNNGDTTFFDVYNGTNGTGSVSLVDNIAPVGGSVPLLTFGNGAPTVDTPGSVKSRYFDTLNNQLYICVAVDEESTPNTYTWRGSSVTVDSYLSTTSTNPVQNAVLTALLGTTPLDTTAQTLTEAVNEILTDISGFADNLSDEYDPTATYAVGDLCIHSNTLYRCNTAITTAEAWNSIHWTQTTVDENKVSKSGDTMTGDLTISKTEGQLSVQNTTYSISDTPSSSHSSTHVAFTDNNDSDVARVSGDILTSGGGRVRLTAFNDSDQENALMLYMLNDGTRSVAVTSPGAWRTAIGAVNKAGDTMTGSLTINNSDLDIKNTGADVGRVTDTEARVWHTRHQDNLGNNAAMWLTTFSPQGTVTTNFGARKVVNNTNQDNSIILGVANDATRTVAVSAPSAWRNAIGLNTDVVELKQIVQVNITSISSLPKTIINAGIKSSHIVVGYNCGTPSARVGQWSVTTADGSLTIAGTIRKPTSMRILLAVPRLEFSA